jgi:hypothetical protein
MPPGRSETLTDGQQGTIYMRTRFGPGDRVALFGRTGVITEGRVATGGAVSFVVDGRAVQATVLQAGTPDVPLQGAQVWLVRELVDGVADGGWTLMVDDPYWGVRVQPAEFALGALAEHFVMGYRLCGRVLSAGSPVSGANVSLELDLGCSREGVLLMWDSEEYNQLVYSVSLDTWVEGATVLAPIRTGTDGRWSWIAPRGHGAAYQRATDWVHDRADDDGLLPSRYLVEARACYLGHRVAVSEGVEGIVSLNNGRLTIHGTPGAQVRVGVMDDAGTAHTIPPTGELHFTGLRGADYSLVQYALTSWGGWDSTQGCPRVTVRVPDDTEVSVTLAAMEQYAPEDNIIAGRLYTRPGVPAANVDVMALDLESGELTGPLARTDSTGFWSAYVPPEGLGGEPIVHDATWGTVPILGAPYSDVVLGARAYSGWTTESRPELWRKGSIGHRNFPLTVGGLAVRDAVTGEGYAVEESGDGGYVTSAPLPKFRYIADLDDLVAAGPQARSYDLLCDDEIVEGGFVLGSQPFEGWEAPPATYRAAGHYPETKLLLGGKTHGNLVADAGARVDERLPEAARMGLEFGEWRPVAEVRSGVSGSGLDAMAMTGLLCPYCGAPAERLPEGGVAAQGFCAQCAVAFGDASAMDCRTYFRSRTVAAGRMRWLRVGGSRGLGVVLRDVRYHWRPDLYDETDAYVTQSGAAQRTDAPRWFARHVDELGPPGIAGFDGDETPGFVPGHTLPYYGQLAQVGRELGLAQLKIVFEPGYSLPQALVVDVECDLADGSTETRRVALPAGAAGPRPQCPFGDALRLCTVPKLRAEGAAAPYRGAGLYTGVSDVRLVDPMEAPGCRFRIVCDVPFLASALGVPVEPKASTPVALQVDDPWGNPHLACDGLGQVFLLYTDGGDVWVRRRDGSESSWDVGNRLSDDGASDKGWADRDGAGALQVVREQRGVVTRVARSRDDGRHMEG